MEQVWRENAFRTWTEKHIERVDVLIREDRWITLAQVEAVEGISYGSTQTTVPDDLEHRNVYARCMPKQVSRTEVTLWTNEKLLSGRDDRAHWSIAAGHCGAGWLCPKVKYTIVFHRGTYSYCMEIAFNICFYFLIYSIYLEIYWLMNIQSDILMSTSELVKEIFGQSGPLNIYIYIYTFVIYIPTYFFNVFIHLNGGRSLLWLSLKYDYQHKHTSMTKCADWGFGLSELNNCCLLQVTHFSWLMLFITKKSNAIGVDKSAYRPVHTSPLLFNRCSVLPLFTV